MTDLGSWYKLLWSPLVVLRHLRDSGADYHNWSHQNQKQSHTLPGEDKTVEDAYHQHIQRRDWLKQEGDRHGWQLVEKWECEFQDEMQGDPTMETYVDSLRLPQPLEPRDAFFGGRTNAIKLYHDTQDGEHIKYIDVCSLYPYVNKYCKYPVGHPNIIKTPDTTDVSDYEGLIKCTVLPPRGLYHPLLPYRCRGKLLFPLCSTCAETLARERCKHCDDQRALRGTWVSCELKKAVDMGYEVLHVEEVWHFEQTARYDPSVGETGLFNEYIDTFLRMKQVLYCEFPLRIQALWYINFRISLPSSLFGILIPPWKISSHANSYVFLYLLSGFLILKNKGILTSELGLG